MSHSEYFDRYSDQPFGSMGSFDSHAAEVARRVALDVHHPMHSYAAELVRDMTRPAQEDPSTKQVRQAIEEGVPIAYDVGSYLHYRVFELSDRSGLFVVCPKDLNCESALKRIIGANRVIAVIGSDNGRNSVKLSLESLATVIITDDFDEKYKEIDQ